MPSPRKKFRTRRQIGQALNTLGSSPPGSLGTLDLPTVLGLAAHGDASGGCIVDGSTKAALIPSLGTHNRTTLLDSLDNTDFWTKAVARMEVKTTGGDINGEGFTLISADGTSVTYSFDNVGGNATGTVISAGPPKVVRIQVNGLTAAQIAVQIKTAIEHSNGHTAAKVACTANPGGAGTAFVTLEQQVAGTAGNTMLNTNVAFAHVAIPQQFYGGMGNIASSISCWQMSDAQGNTATVGDALDASEVIRTTSSLLFGPHGPMTKYIPSLENVSKGAKKFFMVAPSNWTAGAWLAIKLKGVTATNDKLYLDGLNNSMAPKPLLDLNLNALDFGATGTGVHQTISNEGVTHYLAGANGNETGLLVVFERDATTSAPLDGWVVRMSSGNISFNS